MKKIVRVLAAYAIALIAQSAWATPSTLFWTPATNYIQPYLIPHIACGPYFNDKSNYPMDLGLGMGAPAGRCAHTGRDRVLAVRPCGSTPLTARATARRASCRCPASRSRRRFNAQFGLVKEDARGGAGKLIGLLPPKDQEHRDADDDQEEGQFHARILDRGRAEPWPEGEPRNRAASTSRPS
jgi:hypothetical protein